MKYAEVLRMQFKYKEAKKAIDEALAINMAAYGAEHGATAESLNNLGQIHRLLGNYDESEALLMEALQLRRKLFGDYHMLTGATLNNLAELNREKGDFFEAINYHNASIESFSEAEGADHPGTINAKGNLGQLQAKKYDDTHPWVIKFGMEDVLAQATKLNDLGKHDESIELYDSLINKKHVMAQLKALAGNASKVPSPHDDQEDDRSAASFGSGTSKGLKGTRYGTGMKEDDSDSIGGSSVSSGLSGVRRKYRKPVSQDLHILTEGRVDGLVNKASQLLTKGDFGEADSILDRALTPSLPVLGEDSYKLYKGTLLHCEIKIMLAQYELCNEMLVEALQRWTDIKGPDHIEVAYAAALLAYLYYIQGMYDASHSLYVQVMEVVSSKLALDPLAAKRTGSEHNILFCNVLIGLAKVNIKLAKIQEALTTLAQAKHLLGESINKESVLHLELRLCFGRIRLFSGDYSGAREVYSRCLDIAVTKFGKSHATVVYVMHKIGQVEFLSGNLAVSSAYVEEALYRRLKTFKDDHPDVAATEQLKGHMLCDLGRYDEAAVFCERAMVSQRISLGPRHPAVARSLHGMARAFILKGLPLQAEEYCQHALDINREAFGRLEDKNPMGAATREMHMAEGENAVKPHPVVSASLTALGENYVAQGLLMKGQLLLEQALGEQEMIFASLREVEGENADNEAEDFSVVYHPHIATAQRELARVNMLQYNIKDANKLISQAGSAFNHICGDDSLFTAACLMIAGDISHAQGLYRDAQIQYSRAAVIFNTELGMNHPLTFFEVAIRATKNISLVGYLEGAATWVSGIFKSYTASSLPKESSKMADLLLLQARILFDKEKFKASYDIAVKAREMYFDTVGNESFFYVQAMLVCCECEIKLDDMDSTKNTLNQCIKITRAAVEHPDNNNVEFSLNYKDKHPLLGEIAAIKALQNNPRYKLGKINEESARVMVSEVKPLFENKLGEDHSYSRWALGRTGVFMNLEKKKSGDDLLKASLKSFAEAQSEGHQLFFTSDSKWVTSLGGYETQPLKKLKSTHEKFTGVQAYMSWAVPIMPSSDASVNSLGSGAISRASGVVIDGVGKPPAYPECPSTEMVLLSNSKVKNWGSIAGEGAVKSSGGKRKGDKQSQAGNGILALAIFNGEAPVSMAVTNMFGAVDAEHTEAIRKAEARARAAAVEEAEQLARELAAAQIEKDDSSIASNSLAGDHSVDGADIVAMTSEEREALEAIRVERAAEEETMDRMRRAREEEEEALLAVKAQREEEEEAAQKVKEELEKFKEELELFRVKHEEEMKRVKEEIALTQAKAVDSEDSSIVKVIAEKAAVVSSAPSLVDATPEKASETAQESLENPILVDEVPPHMTTSGESTAADLLETPNTAALTEDAVVAVAVDDHEDKLPPKRDEEHHIDVDDEPQPTVEAVQRPIEVQSADAKARVALDAANFLFDRAVDFRAKGWYAKARPVLAECLSIRESFVKEAGHQGNAMVLRTKFEMAYNLMDMTLWHEAIRPLDECFKEHKAAASAKGGGSNGMGNGKHRDLAEVIEAQARNFYAMSQFTDAQHKFHDAVKMRVDTMNPGDPQIGRCICAQALNMCAQGKFLEAKATAEKGHAILTKAYGTKNVQTAEGFSARIEILRSMGKYKDANPLMQQCLSLRRRLLNNEHPLIAESCIASAKLLMDQDRYAEAEKWINEGIAMYQIFFGEDDVRVSAAKSLHCKLLRLYGKHHEAIRLQTRIYHWRKDFIIVPQKPDPPKPQTEEEKKRAQAKQKLLDEWDEDIDGPKPPQEEEKEETQEFKNSGQHTLISDSILELGINHLLLGDLKTGNNYIKAALKMRKFIYKDCLVNPMMADALFWRGEGLRFIGDLERARQNHDDAMDLRKRALGKDHPDFGRSQAAIADIMANRGLYDEAESLYRKALKLQRANCSEESLELAHTLSGYADCERQRGNFDIALKNNNDALQIRAMQVKEVNPDAFVLMECIINRSLVQLDALIPPLGVPAAQAIEVVDDDDDAFKLSAEDMVESIGENDDASAALSAAASAKPTGQKPGFEVGTDDLRAAMPRDQDGVVIFQNEGYVAIRSTFQGMLEVMMNLFIAEESEVIFSTKVDNKRDGEDRTPAEIAAERAVEVAQNNPLYINIKGNIAVVDKLEFEAKERFVFSLSNDDKKLFEAAEKRAKLEAVSDEEQRAIDEAKGDAEDDNKSVNSGSASVQSSIRTSQPQAPHLLDEDQLPQHMLDLDHVIKLLRHIGCIDTHPWVRKFVEYRKVIEKPPSEMEVAQMAVKEAIKCNNKGMFTNADVKYDEAITLQIEHLGHIAASTNKSVAETLQQKGRNFEMQCKFSMAKTFYMQAFAINLKIEGVHPDDLMFAEEEKSRAGSPTGSRPTSPGVESLSVASVAPILRESTDPQEPVLNEGCAAAYYGIANIYLAQGHIETSSLMHEKVLRMRKRLHIIKGKFISKGNPAFRNHPSIMQSMAMLASLALDRGDLVSARTQAEAAMDICLNLGRDDPRCYHMDHYGNICDIKQLLGRVCLAEGNLSLAEEHLESAQKMRRNALAYLDTPPPGQTVPSSGDSVASSSSSKVDDHPDYATDYYYLSSLYKTQCRLTEAKKAIGKAMRLSLKYYGRLKQNAAKLSINAKQFLENILESQSFPEIDMLEKRLITQAGGTSGGIQEKISDAFARDPAAGNDFDVSSVLEDGSVVSSIDLADAQYAASQAVVTKALELRTGIDGERLPAFVYRNIPVSNHSMVANTLFMRAEVSLAQGEVEEARLMCDSALNIRKELFGRKSLPTGQSLYQYAQITELAGVVSEAMSLHIVSLDLKMQFCPNIETHPDIIDSMISIGSLKLLLCQLDEGYTKLHTAVEKTISYYGKDHVRSGDAWLAEAEYFRIIADYKRAQVLIQKALKVFKDNYPEYHRRIGQALLEESRVQLAFGMLDISYTLLDQALGHFQMVLSPTHPVTTAGQQLKAEVLMKSGKVLEAKGIVESCLTSHRDLLGKVNWRTSQSLFWLAFNLHALGRYSTAQPIFERALQLLKRALGAENLIVTMAMVALAESYIENAQYDKAKVMHDSVHSIRVRLTSHRIESISSHGRHQDTSEDENKSNMHPDVAESVACIAQLDLIYGKYSVARKGFDDALAMRRSTLGHMHPDVASSMHSLGCCYYEQGDYSEAKQIFERALKMRRTVLPADHFLIVDTQLQVARIFHVTGKLEQASAMYERCLVNQRIARGSRHPVVGRVLHHLGEVSNDLGNYNLARSYFLDSLVIRKASYGIVIDTPPEPSGAINAHKKKKKDSEKEKEEDEEGATKKKEKFHPEIADAIFGLAETYRYKGRYSAPEKEAFSSKGEELLKNETGLVTTSQMKEAQIAAIAEEGSISSSKYEAMKKAYTAAHTGEVADDSISLSTPGTEREMSVATVNLAAIENQFADIDGEFDTGSMVGADMGLNDYAGPQDSPVQVGSKKKQLTLTTMEDGVEVRDEDEEQEWAMPLYERCLDMMLTIFGNDHPKVFIIQQGIALTLRGLGNLLLSHDLFQHILHHRRGLLEHPLLASILFGKAELMRARKEMDDAMMFYEQSLNIRRHILKSTHIAISDCLVGMAETLRFENKFNKAEPLLIKAIQIRQNSFPDNHSHPSIPDAQCSLAMLYYSMGRYLEAQPLYSESLRTRERILGRYHISTAQSLNNFAGLLHTTGKFERALPYYRRTLDIKKEVLGEDHPDVASAKNNLGLLLKAMGEFEESKKMYEEALSSFKKSFGEMHADVASTLNNMAALYVAVGDTQMGKDLYRNSLHIKKKVLGVEHTAVAASLNNLAGLCFSCGDMDDAKDYYEESLRIRRQVYGDDHPTVAESMNNIGLLLFAQGDYSNSKPLFEKAIRIKSESFGEDHISTASSQHNLAILLHKMKRFTEAEILYSAALEVRTENLGPEHPDTMATADNMNALAIDKGRGSEVNQFETNSKKVASFGSMGLNEPQGSMKLIDNGLTQDSKYLIGTSNAVHIETKRRAFRDDDSREVRTQAEDDNSELSLEEGSNY
eukprot:GSChrysophyteH1.ASY1.ANO1.1735.1 assembled CDS